ncbi:MULTISPECIES: hypothetical protein [Bradyrhizobium]|jgi:hypothetical protein|uniref:hypothetical protein n=1 Tax=Bradyrhizobium TaxID=374 RepID=UPI0004B10F56|nr:MULTISPECIES: hypothetical protein [Bradyrhizobium]MCS3451207.1 hypothetical protein [Bradyrhizobium elkanii]MCS3566770.1 hypothetical protein [Bradyrhizobium elkanii]MCW2152506.1 hypothetical protein [Bradyrhizobium elkanii]MCW2357617.1 hypothetical protein [Bradyrhizobium elkanii]MCW2376236.1 hypothetical protein [Bradyrhizobium elkanii]
MTVAESVRPEGVGATVVSGSIGGPDQMSIDAGEAIIVPAPTGGRYGTSGDRHAS